MVISGLVFERNLLLVSSDLYHIQAQENLCDRVVDHTPNCTPSMYATHFNYNCWYRKAIIHKLKPYKAWWSFSHSPLGSLSSVIDNPYHPTKYQRTGKKPWYHPSLRKEIVTVWQTADFPCICSVQWFILFVLWTIVRTRFIVKDVLFSLIKSAGSNKKLHYMRNLGAHNFHWVQWKADSVYFVCEKNNV